jgi:chromosome segregation ATPase
MVKLNYSVSAGIMEFPDGKCIEVGLAQWWDWIESAQAKSFRFECDHGVKSYTARKERVKDLEVWYAYKSVGGKLRKRYIGKSDQLTQERLEIVAYDLEKEPQSRQKPQTLHSELGNEVGEYRELLNESRRIAVQRESDFERLLAQKIQLQEELKRLNDVLVTRDRNFEEATQQIAKLKRQLEETTLALPSELGNSEAETLRAEVKRLTQERSSLDQRIDELEEKTGDLGLIIQLKDEEIANLKQQLDKAIAQSLHNEVGNSEAQQIDSGVLLSRLKAYLSGKPKLSISKLEELLDECALDK